jgi:small basic protein
MEYISQSTQFLESSLAYPLSNPYIMAVLKISLALYGAQIAPRSPKYIETLFKNTFVKIILIFFIIYISEKDIQLAIILAVIYVLGMNVISGRGIFESFTNYSAEYKGSGAKMLEPKTMLYPGCESVTMDDLYKMFEGDKAKLQNSVQYSFQELLLKANTKSSKELVMKLAYAAGLPYNLSFDKPETAPYIATLLVNYGFEINDKCHPPK